MATQCVIEGVEHRVYHEGKVQSLAFKTSNGRDSTIGIVQPGKWDFGIAKRLETIVVTYGIMKINGEEAHATMLRKIKPGEQIIFEAEEVACYYCYYD